MFVEQVGQMVRVGVRWLRNCQELTDRSGRPCHNETRFRQRKTLAVKGMTVTDERRPLPLRRDDDDDDAIP